MEARYLAREAFEALRGPRGLTARFAGLWCAGDPQALRRPCVAVVGTRAASAYGRRVARRMAADLGRAGCTILSGLALGIDTAAHEGALDAHAPTVGVLGGGHTHFFPPRNAELAARMLVGGGAILSPFPPEHPPRPPQFLQRNGVVAALADAVVVVEAPSRSGALNTASWAAERIPVLAVPADVERPHSAGCLALLRDGALLARHAADVLEALGICAPDSPASAPAAEALLPEDPLARTVLRILAEGESGLDELAEATQAPSAQLAALLTRLELAGRIEGLAGNRWARALERR